MAASERFLDHFERSVLLFVDRVVEIDYEPGQRSPDIARSASA
jgi:hypothetical protein